MCQCSCPAVPDDAAVIDDLLELGRCRTAVSGCKVCLPAYIRRIKAGNIGDKTNLAVLDGRQGGLQEVDRAGCILAVERQLRLNRGQPKGLHLRVQREPLVQVLRQRFGSCGITGQGERQGGFDLDGLTRGNKLQSLGC